MCVGIYYYVFCYVGGTPIHTHTQKLELNSIKRV